MNMNIGTQIFTPRFCTVTIGHIFDHPLKAIEAGFVEPTYYDNDPDYDVRGKSIDLYHMEFAAIRKHP